MIILSSFKFVHKWKNRMKTTVLTQIVGKYEDKF